MNRIQPIVLAGLIPAAAALLAGCASGGGTTRVTETVTVTAEPSSTQAAAPTAPQAKPAGLGTAQMTSVGVTATPFTLENPTTRQPDPSVSKFEGAQPWTVLDAELCAGTEPIAKTGYGFTLVDEANREYKSYDSSLQPFTPTITGGDLAPGECARGYVNFQLPPDAKIVAVRWDYPGGEGPLRWPLP